MPLHNPNVSAPDGLVGAPSISFFNQPGMGLYRIGTNILGISTAGVEALHIDASQNLQHADGANIILGSTTGTKIGTATSQKLAFFNSTPIIQPVGTTDLRTALINLGLYATGGASPLNLNGGTLTAATASLTNLLSDSLTIKPLTTNTNFTGFLSPAGTGQIATLYLCGASDLNNTGYVALQPRSDTNELRVQIGKGGTGTAPDLAIYNGVGGVSLIAYANGDLSLGASTKKIGFLGAGVVVQQASAANLTNNVTSGGTTDTIANYTDLTIYTNDAAAIRNNIYQLARKLKQVNDALRLYGLLT